MLHNKILTMNYNIIIEVMLQNRLHYAFKIFFLIIINIDGVVTIFFFKLKYFMTQTKKEKRKQQKIDSQLY